MKKLWKKLLAITTAVMMVVTLLPAMARASTASENAVIKDNFDLSQKGSITIHKTSQDANEPLKDAGFTLYKLVSFKAMNDGTIVVDEEHSVENSGLKGNINLIDFKTILSNIPENAKKETNEYKDNDKVIRYEEKKTNENGDVKFEDLDPAIYLVVESYVPQVTGKQLFESKPFLVSIPYTAGQDENGNTIGSTDNSGQKWIYDITATPKNNSAQGSKKITNKTPDAAGNVSAKVGDTVSYRIEAKSPAYSTATDGSKIGFEIRDKLTNLEFVSDSIKAYIVSESGDAEIDNQNYTVITNDNDYTFKVSFKEDWIRTHPNTKVAISYNATVTEAAKIGSDANTNEAAIVFNNDPDNNSYKIPDVPRVYTYGFELTKNGKNEVLKNIVFELYKDSVKEENKITAIKYGAEQDGTFITKDNGKIIIKGLEAGTYYLKETKTEKGYTLLANPVKIEINETPDETTGTTFSECKVDGNSANKVEITENSGNYYFAFTVQNNKGFNLPATGGMGTYLFTIGGLVIMAGAVFLLITFKKKRA